MVIVNDAGPSPRGFLDLEDPRVRLVDLSQNGGVSLARNRGLQETQGEIVFFLDADDYVAPDLFRIAIDALESCRAPVLSVGMMTIPGRGNRRQFREVALRSARWSIVIQSPRETFEDFQTNSGRYIPSVTFLRRDALLAHMGGAPWKVGLRNNQDALLFLTMAARHDHAHLSDRLVIYTRRPGSLSASDPARSWTGRIEAMDLLLAHLRGRNADPELIRIARHLRQGAARRVARIRSEQGRANEGRRVLREDLATAFNWKSAAELARSYLTPRSREARES